MKQGKKEREDLNQDSLQLETEGSTTPVPEKSTFYTSVTKGSTISSHLLHFSITNKIRLFLDLFLFF